MLGHPPGVSPSPSPVSTLLPYLLTQCIIHFSSQYLHCLREALFRPLEELSPITAMGVQPAGSQECTRSRYWHLQVPSSSQAAPSHWQHSGGPRPTVGFLSWHGVSFAPGLFARLAGTWSHLHGIWRSPLLSLVFKLHDGLQPFPPQSCFFPAYLPQVLPFSTLFFAPNSTSAPAFLEVPPDASPVFSTLRSLHLLFFAALGLFTACHCVLGGCEHIGIKSVSSGRAGICLVLLLTASPDPGLLPFTLE